MIVSSVGDVLTEVASAADPSRVRQATFNMTTPLAYAGGSVADDPLAKAGSVVRSLGFDAYASRIAMKSDAGSLTNSLNANLTIKKDPTPYQQLEALILQSFVENMMPKNAENLFGKGLAGSYWKSMMAEQVSSKIAASGGIGIAEMLEKAVDKKSKA